MIVAFDANLLLPILQPGVSVVPQPRESIRSRSCAAWSI
jgi:hypothetical protein